VIESDDPLRPDADDDGFGEVRLPLLGMSTFDLAVSPLRLDFGRLTVGSEATRQFRVTNHGEAPLTLTGSHSSDPSFVMESEFSSIEPGEVGLVNVRFQPLTTGEIHGVLTLGLTAVTESTVVVSVVGSAFSAAHGGDRTSRR
jgi:hypothetical protein